MRSEAAPLLPAVKSHPNCADDELYRIESCLRWLCLDQSTAGLAALSWAAFFVLAVAIPAASSFAISPRPAHLPYDLVAQTSLTAASALSFLALAAATRRYGLRRFLFFDKLAGARSRVHAATLLSSVVLICILSFLPTRM